jgi:formyl-CoA transferase
MKAVEDVKVLDFTHVQSGLLGWFGTDVIKIECLDAEDALGTKIQTMHQ